MQFVLILECPKLFIIYKQLLEARLIKVYISSLAIQYFVTLLYFVLLNSYTLRALENNRYQDISKKIYHFQDRCVFNPSERKSHREPGLASKGL